MNRRIPTVADIRLKYPNLVQQCRFVAHITTRQAALIIWSYKLKLPGNVGGKIVVSLGGVEHLLSQAFRYRNA